MRVWTIQPQSVWDQIQRDGEAHVDPSLNPTATKYPGYVNPAYLWLADQLTCRVDSYSGKQPWWAYCKRPDLRWHRHHWPRGSSQVRIELDVSDSHVITFPSWAWDAVFGQDYLAYDREEYEAWESALRIAVPDEDTWPLPEPWNSQLKATWTRLFDPALSDEPWGRTLFEESGREAVTESLRLDDVRRVTSFIGAAKVS